MSASRSALSRRAFNQLTLASAGSLTGLSLPRRAPAAITAEAQRPRLDWGVSTGEVTTDSAVIWSRTDRAAAMHLEVAADEKFSRILQRHRGRDALQRSDFTSQFRIRKLPAGEHLWYRVRFESLEQPGVFSAPLTGHFRTAPQERRNIRFLWSGDTVGQGFGIDTSRGGMLTYKTMLEQQPDFFVHSGDTIYADNPLVESLTLDDGSTWHNLVTPEKSKVAETLDEFRGNFRYNHLDEHFRNFHAQVPVVVQWDDHEVLNNWYPGEILDDEQYSVKSVSLLAARARAAFFEYHPIRPSQTDRVYRRVPYGPDLDLFLLDMRSYRAANSPNDQPVPGPETAFLGDQQLRWIKRELTQSSARWKVICADMPIGLICRDGANFENMANGNGPPLGRELEMASLLSHLRKHNVQNTIWITTDVHYAASHYYDPNRARFQDFLPFWEFVSGPLHAGNFGPNRLDDTFGPQVVFQSIRPGTKSRRPPSDGLQFFGRIDIDGQTGELTVSHYNVAGERLWEKAFPPAA
jgi:alkaline phosphatase D